MNQSEKQPTQQSGAVQAVSPTPLPMIGDDQWNKDITSILASNANNAIAELGFNPNVIRALKDADSDATRLKAEKKIIDNKCRDLSAHLALANSRIDFSKQDVHAMWKEAIYYREKYHVLHRQYQEVLRAHSACATGPPEQPYIHLLQELEKLQDMYRHILGQNTTLKFEVQRLMQQCVNTGLIPPPLNYNVTPLPALQPPATARRVSEPAVAGHQQQTQVPLHYAQGAQPGQVGRQFISPPSNSYTPTLPAAGNPTVVAGPIQAYNYHRAQFPQVAAQPMPPPQQQQPHQQQHQQQQASPQQGQPSVPRHQSSTTRPRQVFDPTNLDDERIPKRPRMASDPNVYTRRSPGSVHHFQHQVNAQMPPPAPYQIMQQRIAQQGSQAVPMDHMQNQPMQQYYPQRSYAAPANSYHHTPPHTPSTYVSSYEATSLLNVPAPSISAPPVMDTYGAIMDELGTTQIQDRPPDAQTWVRGNDQPQQVHKNPTHPTNRTETPVERSAGTPSVSTPVAPPPDSVPASPQVMMNGRTHGGEASLPPLTEEQIKQMRSEIADSMFAEPQEGDETQGRVCVLCHHRSELGILTVPLQPLLKPTTEEMYSHLHAQHRESLEIEERDWKMELFGMGPLKNQQE